MARSQYAEQKNMFLDGSSSSRASSEEEGYVAPVRPQRRTNWTVIHLVLIATYTTIFLYATYRSKVDDFFGGVPEVFSPAHGEVKYMIKQPMDHDTHSPYYGEPRLEMDQAWYEVFQGTIIEVTPEELAKAEMTSFKIAGSDKYGASLGVYHDLHCLKRIKQWMYPDYYYANITQTVYDQTYEHLQHCFEVLRESLMCRPDLTIIGYDSEHVSVRGTPATLSGKSRCVDWDALHAWSLNRAPEDPVYAYQYSESRPENQPIKPEA